MSVVTVEGLRKSYGTLVAVQDVTLAVEDGEVFGILGPNGAGKTTTVECVAGLRVPDAGRIEVLGLDPRADADRLHERVGVQQQQGALPAKLRVGEALELYAGFYRDAEDPRGLAATLGLTGKWDTPYRNLSGGQKQRLSIALALVGRPRLAILDELTTGLDPAARRETWGLIRSMRDRGVTVVLVTHSMEEAEELCDRVALIDGGSVVASGTPASLARDHGGGTRMSFRPTAGVDDAVLSGLPGVRQVAHDGVRVEVSGTPDAIVDVVLALDRVGVRPAELEVTSATLDDAFLALTGHRFHEAEDAR